MKHLFFYIILIAVLMLNAGCKGKRTVNSNQILTDSLTRVLYDLMSDHPAEALALVDSLKEEGIYGEGTANCRKAQIYSEQYQPRLSRIYAKRALEDEAISQRRGELYLAHNLLINSALNVGDTELALKYATAAMAVIRADTSQTAREYAPDFMTCIANCQMKLEHRKEGSESYERAWQMYEDILEGAKSFSWFYPELMLTTDAINDHSNNGDYETARKWLPRLLSSYERTVGASDIPAHVKDDCTADMEITQAKFFLREGDRAEAERHYQAFLKTNLAQTVIGRKTASDYLLMAQRWPELERAVESADSFYVENGQSHSMGYLTKVLARKFLAQEKQGRKDAAQQTASKLINLLDTVEEKTNIDNAAELAIVYETQEKEQKIAQQETALTRQRLIAMILAFVLTVVFFIIYTLHRRAAARRLAILSAQKERMDSELRIARNIQMSMVPGVFPERDGLDLFASMTPAREVGGDLYGYLLLGTKLYFCVGDVSGKGVPASLFMAQATRLFLTLSKQQMKPAEIANRLNEELTENNENSMFVTMFIGLADLSTGHLDFCNCGHNPPVWSGRLLEGIETNVPIGLWPGYSFVDASIDSIKGQPFFVYSDGLNEAENRFHEQFGNDRLLQTLRVNTNATSSEIIESMAKEVELFRGGTESNDDLTMLCLIIK